MALVALLVSSVMARSYKKNHDGSYVEPFVVQYKWAVHNCVPLTEEHTYVLIFDKNQYTGGIECLKSQPDIEIIYESTPASNINHPGQSANTVVMFELKKTNEGLDKPLPTLQE